LVKIRFDPEALLELRHAAEFYEGSRPGLGQTFLACVETATGEILKHPLMWRRIKGRFRRYLVQEFPYGLIYAVQGDIIYIAAVMHLKRKPGYWASRTREPAS
jgi:toxin ParE1/3/4